MNLRHTDREYAHQLETLRRSLLEMAGLVEQMIGDAVQALVHRDPALAKTTIEADHRVNSLEVETDELCLLILAKRQPMASDLRFITLALKMVTDLERIGDLAVNICERVEDLAKDPELRPMDDIAEMGRIARGMVRGAIDAFVQGDVDGAQHVLDSDDRVDELYHDVFRNVLDQMVSESGTVARGIHIQSVAKWLERIGDHATNLAELVIFMIKGKDIRHLGNM